MQRNVFRQKLCLMLLALLPATADARTLGELEFENCTLSVELTPSTVEAFCTTLQVPENHDDPSGRQIELALAWVPARDSEYADPVFMIAGGPGQSARDSYLSAAPAFSDIRRSRHVLLLDQRGTGASNPLICDSEELLGEDSVEEPDAAVMIQAAQDCLDDIGDRADVRFYSTTDAIRDLDMVRQRIGAAQINLVAISYGTRVAQQYAKRYPEYTRALILDGIAPNSLVLGSDHSRNLESALDQYFGRCVADEECFSRLGDPRERLERLMQLADSEEAPLVRYRDPVSAELREERFSRSHVAIVVRMFSYSPTTAVLLPLTLHEAIEGRPELLMAQSRMLISTLTQQINHGMQLSVMCTEDSAEMEAREEDAGSILGNTMIEVAVSQCSVWPVNERPEGFREPLTGNVPALLFSGELDPVTPPEYGEEVVAHLPRGRHLILSGQGHNVIGTGCTPRLMARFLDTLDAAELDDSCLQNLRVLPPFSSFSGWEP